MIKCKYCGYSGEWVKVTTLNKTEKKQKVTFYCGQCGNEIYVKWGKKPKMIMSEKQIT